MPANLTDQALFHVEHSDGDEEDLDEDEVNAAVEMYHDSASLAGSHQQTAAVVRAAPSAKSARSNSDKGPNVGSDKHNSTHNLDILALAASATPTQANSTGIRVFRDGIFDIRGG